MAPSSPVARTKRAILFCLFMGAIFTASVIPFRGSFVVEGLGEDPWTFRLSPILSALVPILVNRAFGERVDRGARPYPHILIADQWPWTSDR